MTLCSKRFILIVISLLFCCVSTNISKRECSKDDLSGNCLPVDQQIQETLNAAPADDELILFLQNNGVSTQTIQSLIENEVNTMYVFR